MKIDNNIGKLKYPIGEFESPQFITQQNLQNYISDLENFPDRLKSLVKDFSKEQLNTPYRPGGWTVKQTVHHIADSSMNAYIRFKLALTEETPVIKPYFEARWAELPDYNDAEIETSIELLKHLHKRWGQLLRGLTEKDFGKRFFHPEFDKEYSLKETAAMYSWHCRHHYAHIDELRKRMNW